MRKLAAVLVAVVLGLFAGAEMAYAQADGVQRVADADWHSGAYDSEKGTNFADPNGYKRMVQVQGAGDAGSGDAGSGVLTKNTNRSRPASSASAAPNTASASGSCDFTSAARPAAQRC